MNFFKKYIYICVCVCLGFASASTEFLQYKAPIWLKNANDARKKRQHHSSSYTVNTENKTNHKAVLKYYNEISLLVLNRKFSQSQQQIYSVRTCQQTFQAAFLQIYLTLLFLNLKFQKAHFGNEMFYKIKFYCTLIYNENKTGLWMVCYISASGDLFLKTNSCKSSWPADCASDSCIRV